jgi:hypothetical protein
VSGPPNAERRPADHRAPLRGLATATPTSVVRPTDSTPARRADVAVFKDGEAFLIATPRRSRPPTEVNPAMRGTSATWDPQHGAWLVTTVEELQAVVVNLRARGLTVDGKVRSWSPQADYRTPDPLPECSVCATPYRRVGLVPRHCVTCGERLELQVFNVAADMNRRHQVACSCGTLIDGTAAYCGACGSVAHG